MERLTGIGVSPGVVVGRAVILTQRTEVMRYPIPPDRVDREILRLQRARDASRRQVQQIRARLTEGRGRELGAHAILASLIIGLICHIMASTWY